MKEINMYVWNVYMLLATISFAFCISFYNIYYIFRIKLFKNIRQGNRRKFMCIYNSLRFLYLTCSFYDEMVIMV